MPIQQLVDSVCKRPGMYVCPPTFDGVCAYLSGFDSARDGGPLQGLREWLVVRLRNGNNLHWTGLARMALRLEDTDSSEAIARLGLLLEEFFEYRQQHGVARIFCDYGQWLSKQSWYDGPLKTKRKRA
jgi:hypothetical protein